MTAQEAIKKLPKDSHFFKGTGDKKYKVLMKMDDGSLKTVQFGSAKYEHYKDQIPKELGGQRWAHKNHLDEERRESYRRRHSKIKNKDGKLAYKEIYSPAWFSWHFLW